MNVQLCFAYLLFETINMSTPFLFHSFYRSTKRGKYFLNKFGESQKGIIYVYDQPKEYTKFFKGKSKQNLPATLYIKFDFVSPQYGQLNGSLSNLPFTSNQLIQPPYRLSPALTRGHGDLHLNGQLLGGCWWPTHNLRNKMGGKKYPPKCHEKQSEKLFHPTPAKLIIF